ncbi:hypothetical protein K8I28_12985, partial [bacterium]|nr:hypothetical protein [bacterium]
MILSLFFSLITAIYPWNLNGSAYVTSGQYSDNRDFVSYAGYVGMDRRNRDIFVIGYESLSEETDQGLTLEQEQLFIRGTWYGAKAFQGGMFGGYINRADNTVDSWLIGTH